MAFTDDFNRADSTTVSNGWIERVDSRWEVRTNQLYFTGTVGGNYLDIQCLRPTSENFTNGTVVVEFKLTSADNSPMVIGRYTANYFYAAWVYSNTLYLSKIINRTKTDLGNQSTGALSNGVYYRLTLILSGSSLTARVHRVSDSVQLAEVTVTDSSITNSGQTGVTGQTWPDFYFDNFLATQTLDATKSVTDSGAGVDFVQATDTSNNKISTDSGSGSETVGISVIAPVADAGQGQDSVSITVFIGVGDTGVGVDAPAIVQPPMLSLLERFDGTLNNWTLDTSGGTAQIQTVNFDEKLILNDTSASALVSATRAIEGQSAPFCIETDIYVGTGAIGLLEALDVANNVLFSIKADAGAGLGTFDTDTDTASTFALTVSAYYNIVFYCDPLTDTVRAWYLTGTGTAPTAWTAIGVAKVYSGGLVSKIRLTTDTAATGEARFDEVKVFRPNVFCIGDSNTAGYSATGPTWNPCPSADPRMGSTEDEGHSYPHLLGLKFAPGQWAANRGINADQSSHVDGRIQAAVIDQGAQTVVILIGTNDITAGVALATIETNIQSAANKAATAGLTVCLCSVPPCNNWTAGQNTVRNTLNAWIQSHAAANGYRFADVFTAVKNPSNPDQIAPAYDAGDGLHFTTSGLQVIANTVYSALLETKSIFDTAIGADLIEVRRLVALAEGALGADNLNILGMVSISDTCAGADSLGIFATIQLLELAAAVEGLVAGGMPESHSITDTGEGIDSVTAIIKEGATLQNIYDLTMTRLAASNYVAPDNEGITSLLSHAIGMSKWKNNKLARTAVNGWIETWVLYDDDSTTPLLTWTHDTTTMTRSKAL